jgi:hypothetical protein
MLLHELEWEHWDSGPRWTRYAKLGQYRIFSNERLEFFWIDRGPYSGSAMTSSADPIEAQCLLYELLAEVSPEHQDAAA